MKLLNPRDSRQAIAAYELLPGGLSIDCGCFGGGGDDADAGPASYPTSIGRDLVFLAMAAWTVRRPFERFAVRP